MPRLRNIGIIAHIDAGKTTFTERVLFYSGVIRRMGEVHEGAATTDFLPEEQERGITIEASCVHFLWAGCAINLIDTPGHIDFSMEVERSLRVLDAAVGIFCGISGVEPQAEQVWRQSGRFAIPRLAVINKMDREGASFDRVLNELASTLDVTPLPVTIPLGAGESFYGIVDLVTRQVLEFPPESAGRTITFRPLEPAEETLAAPYLESLYNHVTEEDDTLLELWLAGQPLPQEAVRAAIRKGTLARRLTPVFAASALRNTGIQPVMDALVQYLPAPDEASPVVALPCSGQNTTMTEEVLLTPDSTAPFCGFVFKTVREKRGGLTAFVRIYCGTIEAGDVLQVYSQLRMSRTPEAEQGEAPPRTLTVSHIMHIVADEREDRTKAVAGEIIALAGCEGLVTGDTLCAKGMAVSLDPVEIQPPVLSLAFESADGTELAALEAALEAIAADDLSVRVSGQGGQRVVSGMGELHLEIVHTRLKREFGLCPRVGNPQVICFEQPLRTAEGTGEFTRILGNREHYGYVRLSISPAVGAENWRGLHTQGIHTSHEQFLHLHFAPDVSPQLTHFQEAVREGIMASAGCGPKGAPLVFASVTILSLGDYSGRESEAGFRTAAQIAFFRALAEGGTALLEPFMTITATAPESYFGAVLNLLASCGAEVLGLADAEGKKQVRAEAPVRELFGFASRLRSATKGRAGMSMAFSRYATHKG